MEGSLKLKSCKNASVVARGSGGPANLEYYVLSTTDVALPLSAWTRSATNRFDASGSFSFTIPVDASAPQRFFALQVR
jgi:hypothetical protein